MLRLPALVVAAGLLAGAADLPREVILLARARAIMSSNLSRLPNYTCLQTIERFERAAPNRKPRLLDIVRLEVALVQGKELFAWPGSGQFSDREISKIVSGGAIGNGNFALHARSVFQTNAPRFTYSGEQMREGRRLHQWRYEVPQNLSNYTIRVGGVGAIVGYHGTILVDADTLDLVRLEVEADHIPPHLNLLSARDAVEYSRISIANESFLLPALSELEMVAFNGSSNANRTRFNGCKHYSGESRILFDDPEPSEMPAAVPQRVVGAPEGIRVETELAAEISLQNAAVGDPFTAELRNRIQLPDGTELPKKALVHGRILSLRKQQMGRYSGRAIGISLHQIDAGSTLVQIQATLEDIQTAMPGIRARSDFRSRERVENEEIVGSIFFVQENVSLLRKGLRMVWRTTSPGSGDDQ